MNKQEFLEGMTFLGIAYNKEFTKQEIEVWYQMLGKYTKEEFSNATQELIKTHRSLPSIAEITKQISEMKLSNLPEAEDEWQEVINAVHRFGYYREKEALESLSPYTAKIVSYVGYKRICESTSEEQTWNKKEFIGEYNTLKDKEIINLQIGNEERKLLSE